MQDDAAADSYSSNLPVETWQARHLGTRPNLASWLQSVEARLQRLEARAASRDERRIRSVAVPILRVACGTESSSSPCPDRLPYVPASWEEHVSNQRVREAALRLQMQCRLPLMAAYGECRNAEQEPQVLHQTNQFRRWVDHPPLAYPRGRDTGRAHIRYSGTPDWDRTT